MREEITQEQEKIKEYRRKIAEAKSIKEQIEIDEEFCIPGSLAHDKKLAKEREEYQKIRRNRSYVLEQNKKH